MRRTYSLYEAKAHLSAIVRQVREGHAVIVTVHGEPAAQITPVTAPPAGLAARLEALAQRGALVEPRDPDAPLSVGPHKRGALSRFLADRNE
ncbi:MAG: type II toxin-antitoxin system prevent-host-death family antitoxin [Gemmatimonadota bacterium]|nr:type II toxin-antitoxin system prevent-host-death family antitoxin [Gemmatimonadota bacterium]